MDTHGWLIYGNGEGALQQRCVSCLDTIYPAWSYDGWVLIHVSSGLLIFFSFSCQVRFDIDN